MRIEDLLSEQALGIPVAYELFLKKTNPPFCIYIENETTNIYGDDAVMALERSYDIELYTMNKRIRSLEERLEQHLTSQDIIFEKTVVGYIESEKMCEVVYSISILESEEN